MRLHRILTSTAVLSLSLFTVISASAQTATTPVNRRARVRPAPVAASTDASQPLEAPVISSTAEAPRWTQGLKWSAFFDGEGRYGNKDTIPSRGFTINDGALFVTKDFSQARALIDLPFFSDTSAGTNHFLFASQEAQAFVEFNKWEHSFVKVGQYETFFGVEANHSRDRFFANAGVLKSYFLPYTHTGAQYGYRTGGLTARAQLTDPNGAGAMAQENPEVAGDLRFDVNNAYAALGASVNQARASSTTNNTNLLVDLTGGLIRTGFRIDGQIDAKTTANTNKTGMGFGLYGSMPVSQALALGARIEYATNVFAVLPNNIANTYDSIFALAVGPSYKLMQDITLRGDLTVGSYTATAGYNDTQFGVAVSLVAEL